MGSYKTYFDICLNSSINELFVVRNGIGLLIEVESNHGSLFASKIFLNSCFISI